MKTKTVLWEARKALQDGDRTGARKMLEELVQSEPDNADAWLLLFNTLDNPVEKLDALKQVQRIRPNDETIHEKLRRYKASAEYRAVKAEQHAAKKQAEAESKAERKRSEDRSAVRNFFSSLFGKIFSPPDDPDRGIFKLFRPR